MLTVNFEESGGQRDPGAGQTGGPSRARSIPSMMPMLKAMFQGFKVAIDLEVDGKIVKTNADYVNGSRITLLEIEMAGLFEDEAKLRELQTKIGPAPRSRTIRPLLKDVKGVKVNHPVVTVEYR